MTYIGRFAPSPTGPLHAGSLVAAVASWLDARAHGGLWLVRMEDVDTARCSVEAGRHILRQLADLGLLSDREPLWQSTRGAAYQSAFETLAVTGFTYPCGCSRSDVAAAHALAGRVAQAHRPLPYPGTCRTGVEGCAPRAWRFACEKYQHSLTASLGSQSDTRPHIRANGVVYWTDRRLHQQSQNVAIDVGDFVLKRADGDWSYQLAVVVDDAAQGVTHVVRGADLADNTPRQWLLQNALGLPVPLYLHTPLVSRPDGDKLSKQHGAAAVETETSEQGLQALGRAGAVLGLPPTSGKVSMGQTLEQWVVAWKAIYNPAE